MLLLNFNKKNIFTFFGFPLDFNYNLLLFKYWIPYDFNYVTRSIRLKANFKRMRSYYKGRMRQSFQVLNINSSIDSIYRTIFFIYDGYKTYRKIEPYFIIRKFLRILVSYRKFFIEYVKYYTNLVDNHLLIRSFTLRTRFNFSFFKVHHYFFCCTSYLRLVRRFNLYFFHKKFYIMRFILRTLSFKRMISQSNDRYPLSVRIFFSIHDIISYKQKRYLIFNNLISLISNNSSIYPISLQTFFSVGFFNFYFFFYHKKFKESVVDNIKINKNISSLKLFSFSYLNFFYKYIYFFLFKQRLFYSLHFIKKFSYIYYIFYEFKFIRFLFGFLFFNFYLPLNIYYFYLFLYKKILNYYNYWIKLFSVFKLIKFNFLFNRYYFSQYIILLSDYSISNLSKILYNLYNFNFSLFFLRFSSVKFIFHNLKLKENYFKRAYMILNWVSKAYRRRKLYKKLKKIYKYRFYKLYKHIIKKIKNFKFFYKINKFNIKYNNFKNYFLSLKNFYLIFKEKNYIHIKNKRKFFRNIKKFFFLIYYNIKNNIMLLRFSLIRSIGLYFAFVFGRFFFFSNNSSQLSNNFYCLNFFNRFLYKTIALNKINLVINLFNNIKKYNYRNYILKFLFNIKFIKIFLKKNKKLFLKFLQQDLIFFFQLNLFKNFNNYIKNFIKRLFFCIIFFELPIFFSNLSNKYIQQNLFISKLNFSFSFFNFYFLYLKSNILNIFKQKLLIIKLLLQKYIINFNKFGYSYYFICYFFLKKFYFFSRFFNIRFSFYYKYYFKYYLSSFFLSMNNYKLLEFYKKNNRMNIYNIKNKYENNNIYKNYKIYKELSLYKYKYKRKFYFLRKYFKQFNYNTYYLKDLIYFSLFWKHYNLKIQNKIKLKLYLLKFGLFNQYFNYFKFRYLYYKYKLKNKKQNIKYKLQLIRSTFFYTLMLLKTFKKYYFLKQSKKSKKIYGKGVYLISYSGKIKKNYRFRNIKINKIIYKIKDKEYAQNK